MTELYTLTALDAIRVAGPYIITAIPYALFVWLMCYITEIKVNRKWLRDPANMKRTVQDHLKRRDDVIKEQAAEIDRLRADNEKMAATIRGVQSRVIGGIE